MEDYAEFVGRWRKWCIAGTPSDRMRADALAWILEYPNIGRAEEIAKAQRAG